MDPRVAAVLSLIETRPDIDVHALAVSANLSRSRLRHLFRTETSQPLCRHLKHRRLTHAALALRTTFLSIKQVSAATGFRDVHHFIREFRKTFGSPPGAYRRAAISDTK
jgi:AraC family transcriptional regulator of arabinose operon